MTQITAESFVRALMREWGLKEEGARVCRELKGGLGEVFVYEGELLRNGVTDMVSIRGEITHSSFLLRASLESCGPLGGTVSHIAKAMVSRASGWTWLTKTISEGGFPPVRKMGVGILLAEVEAEKVAAHMVQGVRMAADELSPGVRGLAWDSSLFRYSGAAVLGLGLLFIGRMIISEA